MDELKLLTSKVADLSRLCLKNGYPAFSKFLDATQRARVSGIKAPGCTYLGFGGYADAERTVMGCFPDGFYDEALYEQMFPICILQLVPSDTEGLTHRDYLGSIMGLGVTRESIGDIVTTEEGAFVFCMEDIADFLLTNCDKIGRRSVKVQKCEEITLPRKNLERLSVTVASDRIDCVVARIGGCSRNQVEELLRTGRVMVNYLPAENGSKRLKPGDTVSVRGFGKFIYIGSLGETKKGRLKIEYDLYK